MNDPMIIWSNDWENLHERLDALETQAQPAKILDDAAIKLLNALDARVSALEKVSSADGQHWLKIGGKSYNDIQARLERLETFKRAYEVEPVGLQQQQAVLQSPHYTTQVAAQQAQMSMTQLAAQQNAIIKARVQEDANVELLKAERERIAERFDKAGKTHDAAYIRAGAFGYPPQYRACATCGESLEKHPAYCGLDCASKGR